MQSLQKALYLSSGFLMGLWVTVLFVKMDFNMTVAGLTEAGNADWENLRFEMIDSIGLLTTGFLILTVIYLVVLGIIFSKPSAK